MKNVRYFLACVALTAVALVGCSRFEENSFFEEGASQRLNQFNKDLKDSLVAQSRDDKNGWVIQYFVGASCEGFNLFGRFYENGKVLLAGNHRYLRDGRKDQYTEHTSFYELLREEGPVLAFNTWNNILTVLVDPVSPQDAPANLIDDGEGLLGDQNLVFEGFKGKNLLFHGERNLAKVRLVPCDRSWEAYIKDTETTKKSITNATITNYYVVSGTDTLFFKDLSSGNFTYCERIIDPLYKSTINCVFTPQGFYLQHRNEIAGTSFQEFRLTEDKSRLISENDSVQVIAMWDNYIINERTASWDFDQSLFTDVQKNLVQQIDAELKKAFNSTFDITSVGLGRGKNVASSIPAPLITFSYSYKSGKKTLKASFGLSVKIGIPSCGRIKIDISPDDPIDSNLKNFIDRNTEKNAEGLVRQFAATLSGTYDMKPNDYFLPTSVDCIPVGGGTAFKISN